MVLLKMLEESRRQVEKQLTAYLSIKNHSQEMLNQSMAQAAALRIMPDQVVGYLERKGEEYVEAYYAGSGGSAPAVSVDIANLPNGAKALFRTLSELIAGGESRGSYNAINRGGGNKGYSCNLSYTGAGPYQGSRAYHVTEMTLQELYRAMSKRGGNRCDHGAIWAAGKYQWTYLPLTDLFQMNRYRNIYNKYRNAKLTPEVQEAINMEFFLLAKRKDLGDYLLGKSNNFDAAVKAIAHEWSSIGHPTKCVSKSVCPSANADKGLMNYEKTQQIFALMRKLNEVNKASNQLN